MAQMKIKSCIKHPKTILNPKGVKMYFLLYKLWVTKIQFLMFEIFLLVVIIQIRVGFNFDELIEAFILL